MADFSSRRLRAEKNVQVPNEAFVVFDFLNFKKPSKGDFAFFDLKFLRQRNLQLKTYNLQLKLGLTGFDRMFGGVCQHAGSWDESLKR